jgi:hypothetical protein
MNLKSGTRNGTASSGRPVPPGERGVDDGDDLRLEVIIVPERFDEGVEEFAVGGERLERFEELRVGLESLGDLIEHTRQASPTS